MMLVIYCRFFFLIKEFTHTGAVKGLNKPSHYVLSSRL